MDLPAEKLRRGEFIVPLFTLVLDALAIEAAFLFSYWLRFKSSLFVTLGFVHGEAPPLDGYIVGSLFIIAAWIALFQSRRMYGARRSVSLSDELVGIARVVSIGMLVVMSAAFFYREFSYSRIVFGLLWGFSVVTIFIGRAIVQWFERRQYRKGRHLQHTVIVGGESLASQVYTRLNGHPSFGFHIVGYFADHPATPASTLSSARYLGTPNEAGSFIKNNDTELVFLALQSGDHRTMFDLVAECEGVNVEFMMVPDLMEVLTSQVRVRELEGIPFLRIKSIPLSIWGRITKRLFDITVSLLLLLVLSPLILLIIVLIRFTSRGPVLFAQERVGLDGKTFTMFKFRSMKAGSEKSDDQVGLGIRDDPRRTRLGVFLRKASLDEIPQMYNVLRGDMSLVGPRPERRRYVERFQENIPKYLDRHRMKTGVTGWAQVNGLRGDTSIEERVKYDLFYIENWSLGFDVKILLRTIKAALSFKEVH
jgi:Undecaprenyl-phosphate glucose phosphotransferase